jgi:hypothetical protein
MKKYILFILGLIPLLINGQRVVILSVHQPPEFGFSISRQDTTIIKGSSIVLGNNVVISGGSGDYSYKWTPAATLSNSVILHPIASPGDTTIYMLTVTDKLGCSISVYYTVNVKGPLTGIDVAVSKTSFDVILFPNPNDGKFKVQISGPFTENIELVLYDTYGRIVKKQTINNFTGNYTESFDAHLNHGAYTLQINAGRETLSRRFIIL